MLIAEELLLLAHDRCPFPSLFDDTPYRLAGALVVDLVIAGRVAVPADAGAVVVLDAAPTGHPELDRALGLAGTRDAAALVDVLARDVERPLLDGLGAQGLLRRDERSSWGPLRGRRWRSEDGPDLATLRARVHGVLLDGEAPDDAVAALLTLGEGSGRLEPPVPRVRRREAELRTREIAGTWWRGTPVREAVGAVAAAVLGVAGSAALLVPAGT